MINKINIHIKIQEKVFIKLLNLIKLIAYKKKIQIVKIIKPKNPLGKKIVINKKIKLKIFKPGCI